MTTKETIQSWLNAAEKDLIIKYNESGRRASGEWEKSLSNEIKITASGFKVIQYGAFYTYWMEKGRNKNKNQDPKTLAGFAYWAGTTFIKDWCVNKGIMEAYAIPIAYSIGKKGYKGRPLTSAIYTDERIKELLTSVQKTMVEELKADIIHILK
jgi:hypothetical protein